MKYPFGRKFIPFFIILIIASINLQSCQITISNSPATPVVITVIITQPATETPSPSPQPTETVTSSPEPTATETPTPTVTPTIAHLSRPDNPHSQGISIWDSDSSSTADQNRPQGGDYFERNQYERPFNATSQDVYFSDVDILQAYLDHESSWVFGKINVKGRNPQTQKVDGSYAVELDLDQDGRGDFLVISNAPDPSDWSTDGVQVYQDTNKDIGEIHPIAPDGQHAGDGYESLIFDQGKGIDPDLAWARLNPAKATEIWIAFKPSMIANDQKYLWGVWASQEGFHPDWFDYNDHFTLAQAGSPFPSAAQYPLKEIAELDNTCRWAVGFNPTGDEPGVCPLAPTAIPKPPKATAPPQNIPTFILRYPTVRLPPTKTPIILY